MRFFNSTIHLAIRDLWHERVLTACLLLSVSAIIAPLLLLFGLKNGIVDTMRGRLLSDPSSREIYPRDIQGTPFPDKWFTETMDRPEVEFVGPRLDVAGDLTVRFSRLPSESNSYATNCQVASVGDPRLPLLGFEAPDDGQVVLTLSLAEKLGIQNGDALTALVDRGGLSSPVETALAKLVVCAIVTETVPADRAWLPLSFLVGVRDFREYLPVPEFGWPGTKDEVEPRYDSLLTLVSRTLAGKELMEVSLKPPGLSDARVIDSDELFRLTGRVSRRESTPSAIMWRPIGNLVPPTAIGDLEKRLGEIGIHSVVLPLIEPIPVKIKCASGVITALNLIVSNESGASESLQTPEAAEVDALFSREWPGGIFQPTPANGEPHEEGLQPQPSLDAPSSDAVRSGAVESVGDLVSTRSGPPAPLILSKDAESLDAENRLAREREENSSTSQPLIRATPVETEPGPNLASTGGETGLSKSPSPTNLPDITESRPTSEAPLLNAERMLPSNPSKVAPESAGRHRLQTEPAALNRIAIEIADSSTVPEGEARILINGEAGLLDVPVLVTKKKGVPEGSALVEAIRGGQIRRALVESIVYEDDHGGFHRKQDKFRDFRLFAARLEDVAPLAREFEEMGIPVHHGSDRIAQILELDTNLTRLFWIIASASAGAGFFGLVASFFAAVERKRRDLGILQLLGMPKLYIFVFPMLQSAFLSFCAFALAFFLFKTFADLINTQFGSELREGETFCKIQRAHALNVLKATMGFGLVASLVAAVRSSRIQPSEALRAE